MLHKGEPTQERIIDLQGPSGNAHVILGIAAKLAEQLEEVDPEGYNKDKIINEMTDSDYKNLVLTFEKYFGDYVKIYNSEILDEL